MYGLPQRTVGALAGWPCALLLQRRPPPRWQAPNPPNRALLQDGPAPTLGAIHALEAVDTKGSPRRRQRWWGGCSAEHSDHALLIAGHAYGANDRGPPGAREVDGGQTSRARAEERIDDVDFC